MKIIPAKLQDVHLIELEPHYDDRGYFARTMCVKEFAERNLEVSFPQHNTAYSPMKGTLRGMHFQVDPYYEVKVVRCIRGAIHDVVIDLRPHSSTYLKWEGFDLSFENNRQLYVPRGFAHGYQTQTNDTIVTYLCSAFYVPGANGGIRHDDPRFAIDWPLKASIVSEKDRSWSDFRD
jgi:dTDP-4-dehydrorhamnose 3,5-epimerase